MRENFLVLDEPVVAMDLAEVLVDLGYNVPSTAYSVREARRLAGTAFLDAAIMDLQPGGEWAFDVADDLATRRIPFLLSSVDDREVLPPRLRDRPFIQKPYEVPELVAAVTRLTGLFGPNTPPPITIEPAVARTLHIYSPHDLDRAERLISEGKERIDRVAALFTRTPTPEGERLLHELRRTLDTMIKYRDKIRRAL